MIAAHPMAEAMAQNGIANRFAIIPRKSIAFGSAVLVACDANLSSHRSCRFPDTGYRRSINT